MRPVRSNTHASAGRPRIDPDPSISDLLERMYSVISFEEGGEPNWQGLEELFSPHARITRITPEATDYMDRSSFLEMTRDLYEIGANTSFYEFELTRDIEQFGDMAQVWSAYETRRHRGARDALGRGINSIQLIREKGAWRVLGLLWDESQADSPPSFIDIPRGAPQNGQD